MTAPVAVGRGRGLRAAAVVALAALLVLALDRPEGAALDGSWGGTRGNVHVEPGDPQLFGLMGLRALDGPLRLLSARPSDAPPSGVVVDGIWAVRASEVDGFLTAARSRSEAERLRPSFHDVREVRLDVGCPSCRSDEERGTWSAWNGDWYLLLEAHIERAGDYELKGFSVSYEVHGYRMTQRFDDVVVAMHSGDRPG